MKLFARFSGNNVPPPPPLDDAMRRAAASGQASAGMSGNSQPMSPTQRHIAIKIPYTPTLPEPTVYASPPPSARAMHTNASLSAPAPLQTPPKREVVPTSTECGTQAGGPPATTEDKATFAQRPQMADAEVQTDPMVIEVPEPEVVESSDDDALAQNETDGESVLSAEEEASVAPENIPLPEDDDEIDYLETEEEREEARYRRENEPLRVPAVVMDLIREALPDLIEAGETEMCMQFLEELLASGNTVRAKHTGTQTSQVGAGWLFQRHQTEQMTKQEAEPKALDQFAVTERPERRRSIC
ncbi:hypothetical protein THASP1DRAFT_32322 [Thamnocephalis sphaerospora]|uniref:Uncharacterized protein n=1 Tax=Thamnocephalis sphaerospora TaxID=78915 RepID=A0A4P9XKP8_9FUNG|nr:hypothetical protein THASP1DRAFT_32322 [Thamnocephalis sphaerospora]|eukprot:RKP05850.1 hypothetical protein THASP1DRAFT_32322 [Thamnocephalis sphaerospora]